MSSLVQIGRSRRERLLDMVVRHSQLTKALKIVPAAKSIHRDLPPFSANGCGDLGFFIVHDMQQSRHIYVCHKDAAESLDFLRVNEIAGVLNICCVEDSETPKNHWRLLLE